MFPGLADQPQLFVHATGAMGIPLRHYSIGMQNVVVSGDICKGSLVRWRWTMSVSKRLERGRFIWPQATEGTVCLTRAQLSMLLEGIDWRRPQRTLDTADRGLIDYCDSPLFMRLLWMLSIVFHGILRS